MAHFAQLDANNVVTQVIVVNNAELIDVNGQESEGKGAAFCASLFGGRWVQTSFNGTFRRRFAGVGYTYNAARDAFIRPRPPMQSWVLDDNTLEWRAPVPMPTDGKQYYWDERTVSWKGIP